VASNGGVFQYGFAQGQSIQGQLNPYSLRAGNYGNSNYDIRHLISGDFVISPTIHAENGFVRQLINGWQWSGKVSWHTSMPYSITDGNDSGAIGNTGGLAGTHLATIIPGAPVQTSSCGKSANNTNTPCLNYNAFFDSNNFLTAISNQTHNTATSSDSTLHRVSFNSRRRSPSKAKANLFQPNRSRETGSCFLYLSSPLRLGVPVLKRSPPSIWSFSRICPNEETYRNLYKQSNIPDHLSKGVPQFRHKSLILVYIFPLIVGSFLAEGISALNRHSLQTLNRAFPTWCE
jgi:hypothetical protein